MFTSKMNKSSNVIVMITYYVPDLAQIKKQIKLVHTMKQDARTCAVTTLGVYIKSRKSGTYVILS